MAKEAVFTMKLEADLRDAFMAEAAAKHMPASQIVRDLMRDFVKQQREQREYDAYLHRKVQAARADVEAGRTFSHEEIEAEAAQWRAELHARLSAEAE